MPLVRYVANKSAKDGTSCVGINGKSLVLGGPSVDLTDDEFARLNARFVLEEVKSETKAVEVEPTPVVPDPETPAQFGVPTQQLPATQGASVSIPNTSTPDSGS